MKKKKFKNEEKAWRKKMCCPLMMRWMIQIRSLAMATKFTQHEEEELLKERGHKRRWPAHR